MGAKSRLQPPRKLGRPAEPKNDKAAFDTAMDDVENFVQDVNARTNNLTEHAHDPYGSGHNLGPMHYPLIGAMPKEDAHNWKGSVQVNIGIDMREYHSLAKWYARSSYANPSKAEPDNRADYRRVKKNIGSAVDIGRAVTGWTSKKASGIFSKQEMKEMGNLRGLRGWITHMALYMLGGKGGMPEGSTAKNLTPILMKSPNDIAINYGMTANEKRLYLNDHNRGMILARLIEKTGRSDLDPNDPLSGDLVSGKGQSANYRSAREKLDRGEEYDDLESAEQNAVVAYETSLGELSKSQDKTLFAGAPIGGEQAVGPSRSDVEVTDTASGHRGGAVVEFRNLPGFYDGPGSWRRLGHDFLREAETRNKRGGKKPDKLSKLKGDEWG